MPAPSEFPDWAETGEAVDPGPTKQAEGWLPSEYPPSQFFNWWQRLVGRWIQYLKDAVIGPSTPQNQADRFVVWDGASGRLLKTAFGIYIDGGHFRTIGHINAEEYVHSDSFLRGTRLHLTSGEIEYDPDKARTLYISSAAFRPGRTTDNVALNFARASIENNGGQIVLDLDFIPDGSTLTRVAVIVDPGAARAGDNRMLLEIWSRTIAISPVSDGGVVSVATASQRDNSTSAVQLIDISGLSLPINKVGGVCRQITLTAGNTAATNIDYCYGAYVEFTQPLLKGI